MADNDQVLQELKSINNRLDEQNSSIAELKQGQKRIETDLAQTKTAVARVTTVVETTEHTVNRMDAGLEEVVENHRTRLKNLEEHTGIHSHKN